MYFFSVLQSSKLCEGIQLIHMIEIPKQSLKSLAKSSITNEAVMNMKRALNVEAKDEGSLPSSLSLWKTSCWTRCICKVVNLPFLVLD